MRYLRALFVVAAMSILVAPWPVLASPAVVHTGQGVEASASHAPRPLARTWPSALAALVFGSVISMKDLGTLSKKYVTRATNAVPDYTAGAAGKGSTMEANAKAAEPAYNAGVQAAISRQAYGKGLSGAAAKYESGVATKGSVRYGPGVQAADQKWASGFQPYADKLKSLTLPPKGARRSPQNQQRSTAVQMALGALK